MSFSLTTDLAPSGAFVSTQGFCGGTPVAGDYSPIFNPGVLEGQRNSFEIRDSFPVGSDEWFHRLSKYQCRVEESDFYFYGEQLTSLATRVQAFEPDCSIGPLRGAAKPCVLVEVMNRGAVQYDFFNFQCGSQPENRGRVLTDVKEILQTRDPETEQFCINVTDTAKGGYGINALASILREIKESTPQFSKQKWHLGVDLLHGADANVSKILQVRKLHVPGSFEIVLKLFPVPNLIFEDYDPALAVEMQFDQGRYLFKPCTRPGKMLLRKDDEVFVIETENAGLMLDEFIAHSITENLLTSHSQVGDVWADYQNKA